MMFVSPHLTFDPTKSLTPDTEQLCNLQAEIPPEVNQYTFDAGQWWVAPLGRSGGNVLVGLRLMPGVALASSPVVEVDGAQAVTLCSSPKYLVPFRLHDRLKFGGESWDQIAKLPAKKWKALVALHQSLGGEDDLDALRALTRDTQIKKVYDSDAVPRKTMAATRVEVLKRLDPSPETAAYAAYLLAFATDKVAPTPAPEAGCWNEALASLALFAAQNDPEEEPRPDEEQWAAWRMTHSVPGLDSALSGSGLQPTWSQEEAATLHKSAAKIVAKRALKAWTADPLYPAIGALAKDKKYNGAEHAAAATILANAKDFAGAFNALITATFWEVASSGAARRDTLETARQLARKAEWTEVADSLDELAQMRADLAEDGC